MCMLFSPALMRLCTSVCIVIAQASTFPPEEQLWLAEDEIHEVFAKRRGAILLAKPNAVSWDDTSLARNDELLGAEAFAGYRHLNAAVSLTYVELQSITLESLHGARRTWPEPPRIRAIAPAHPSQCRYSFPCSASIRIVFISFRIHTVSTPYLLRISGVFLEFPEVLLRIERNVRAKFLRDAVRDGRTPTNDPPQSADVQGVA